MSRRLGPTVASFFASRTAAWQVVSAGLRNELRLPPGGPFSDNAVAVVFEGRSPSIVVVPAGEEIVRRAGAMPMGPEAGARLDALAELRVRAPFGLKATELDRGPIAAMKDSSRKIEQHVRLEFFDGKEIDPVRLLTPAGVVLRHVDSILSHCGVAVKFLDDAAIVVETLGPALSLCPGAIGAIPRGNCDPESTFRIARVENGWRIPIGTVEAGVLARISKALRPGIERLHARYDTSGDLAKPFRSNPRRPTRLASVTNLSKCVVKWFLAIPKGGLKIEHRRTFAGFVNATNRAEEVYKLAGELRPDLLPQLKESKGWKTLRRTCGDVLMNPSRYAALGLVCDCGDASETALKRAASETDVFSPESPLSSDEDKRARFF